MNETHISVELERTVRGLELMEAMEELDLGAFSIYLLPEEEQQPMMDRLFGKVTKAYERKIDFESAYLRMILKR